MQAGERSANMTPQARKQKCQHTKDERRMQQET